MPGWDLLLPFAVGTLLVAYYPGPALLYTAAQTLVRGRRAGLLAAAGIHLGGYAHVVAAALGFSALFRHVPELFVVLKLAGAAYLVWIAIGMLRGSGTTEHATPTAAPARSAKRAFAQSVTVELLNPKVALFFAAFLPQFVDPAAAWPLWVQFLVLGTLVNITFTTADLAAVLLSQHVRDRMQRFARQAGGGPSRAAHWIRWIGGGVMLALAARLAMARTPS